MRWPSPGAGRRDGGGGLSPGRLRIHMAEGRASPELSRPPDGQNTQLRGHWAMRDARYHDRHDGASYRRLELITGSKRRRARSAREKAAIVAETFAPGANVSGVTSPFAQN